MIDRSTRVFFDASYLIAAAGRPSGGSGFLLFVCSIGALTGATSLPVLVEAERNVLFGMGFRAHDTYHRILARTPLILAPTVSKPQLENLRGLINAKDAHVVAATIALEAPFLLTLDKSLEAEVNRNTLPTRAFLPGAFIKQMLPTHREYPIQDPAAWDAWR